uniref:Putative da-p36 protein n=1 Tax=Rhipicephalus pulchellus TaxID=72859 RepID=L7LPT1_RHIPC
MHSLLLTLCIHGFVVAATQGSPTAEKMLPINPVYEVGGKHTTGNLKNQKDTSNMVNITEKAQTLIEYMNRTWHDISSWGMTPDYAFWRGKHNHFGQQPISAYAGSFNCDKELLDYSDLDVKLVMCLWYIPQKICSPVGIYVNVRVPQYDNGIFEEKPIRLNFNNRNIIMRRAPKTKRKPSTKGLKKFAEVCKFTVNVTFDGSLAYETNNPATGRHFLSVGVGLLQDKAKGLIRTKHNRLHYIIRGWFKRVTFWKSHAHVKQNLLE